MSSPLTIENARIWTGDADRPRAGRIVLEDGRVRHLDEGPAAGRRIDARGRSVTPGLIDAHLHLLMGGAQLEELDLGAITSREAFVEAIARRHHELPPDAWLIASGWSNERWPGAVNPDKSWLAPAGDRPVVCHRIDRHAALVNDAVLAACDLERDLPTGRVERDPVSGEPTGLMVEAAAWRLVNPLVPRPAAARRRGHLLAAQRHVHRVGLTTVCTMEYARDVREVFVPEREALTLCCRVVLLDRAWPLDVSFGRDFDNDERLAVIGSKAFIDGTLGSRTARLLADYADDPGNRGLLVELAADGHLVAWARAVAAAGLAPVMHAIGDEAMRLALEAVEAVDPAVRPRIEHAQHIDLGDVARCRGVWLSMQPLHRADDGRYAERRLGPDRLAGAFAFRRLLDAGAHLAFGSDWPIVSCDPLEGIRAAVTGRTTDGGRFGVDQNLTVTEALRGYTVDAAQAVGLLDAGVLRPGARADLVIHDRDPFDADWEHAPPRVTTTIAAGQVVYDDEADR